MEINKNNVHDLFVENPEKYQGIYHFGESEWESNLFIFIDKNIICGQLRYSEWKLDENNNVIGSISYYLNLENIKIEKNILSSDGWSGKFVEYENQKALILDNSKANIDKKIISEIGFKLDCDFDVYHSGKYPSASLKMLTSIDLMKFSKKELKIMRNEIFARYGYIFNPGGEMYKYFNSQEWYSPESNNVNKYLTAIELFNIRAIKERERTATNNGS
jgi:hypothetical protein